jgi:hypothetical protein
VLDRAGQHVGDRLDTAVRMPREPGQVIGGVVVSEVVEEQKRIELGGIAESEAALQTDACAFECRLWMNDLFNWTNRHAGWLLNPV